MGIELKSIQKAKGLLKQLFRSDNADLDFGIYRIMNFKRDEIEKFIEKDLIEAVRVEFQEYAKVSSLELEKEVARIKRQINEVAPGTIDDNGNVTKNFDSPKVQEYLRIIEDYKAASISEEQANDVFNHVYEFFSRYYEDGDFIPKTRYGGRDKYFVPYNGEEVLLHWATKDMYYVKTSEYFKKYSFKAGRFQVTFMLVEPHVESGNIKGKKKYFILHDDNPVSFDKASKKIEIRFDYRSLTDEEEEKYGRQETQEKLVDKALEGIGSSLGVSSVSGILSPRGEGEKSLLNKHLEAYVERNTKDFFIYTNLRNFLLRELDFYLKNEVWSLDELESLSKGGTQLIAAKVTAIKGIALKIIEFLAQIEDFQKGLFEKKKFVSKTDYCMTLDLIQEEYYDEIRKNERQIREWKELYGLDEITKGSLQNTKGKRVLDVDFLISHKYLVLDTKYFSTDFKNKLISGLSDLDSSIDGILIRSENYQALNLINPRFGGKIKCGYIDPPYNTELDRQTGKFLYKDTFEHSSWICLMENRLSLAKDLLSQNGVIFISIDENEIANLLLLGKHVFGYDPVGQYIWKGRAGKAGTIKSVSYQHEYVLGFAKEISDVTFSLEERKHEKGVYRDEKGSYSREQLRQWGQADRRKDRPKMWFGIENPLSNNEPVFPIKDDGSEGRWRVGEKKALELLSAGDLDFVLKNNIWQVYKKIREGKITYSAKGTILDKVGTTADGTKIIQDLFGKRVFEHPKPPQLIEFFVELATVDQDYVIDFFAGSGTTAQAVLNMNAKDNEKRKYILIEMDDHYFSLMIQRIKKLMFSQDWKNGLPNTSQGISHMLKYIYLEQYEDTLNNIELRELDGSIQRRLDRLPDYFITYMLDYETRGNPSRLAFESFRSPFDYKLKILSGGEEKEESVDLVETFNYLLGLYVKRLKAYKDGDRLYRVAFGERNSEQVAVIWRDTIDLDLKKDKKFIENKILKEANPDTVYINGDSYLENANPIEPEFKRLMRV